MQSDETLDDSFRSTKAWEKEPVTGKSSVDVKRFELPSLERGKLSFSGNERNHLFQNKSGREFQDISSVSGLDSPQDGRAFAIWDFDRDGWQDIALLNINTPVLSIYRNQLGSISDSAQANRKMIALQFVGGNATDQPSTKFSSRDGFGVKASIKLESQSFTRELRCGEGLATQNSHTMMFGIGDHDQVNSIVIQWPSGISQHLENVPAGQLIKIFENAADSADGSGFTQSRYIIEGRTAQNIKVNPHHHEQLFSPVISQAKMAIYTSMATWCPNCENQLPQLRRLSELFTEGDLEIIGVPIDESESDEQLAEYLEKKRPPYKLDGQWSSKPREDFKRIVLDHLDQNVLPATIITSQQGEVIAVLPGVPTVSEAARQLHSLSLSKSDNSK